MKRSLFFSGILFAGLVALLLLSSLSQPASAQTMPPTSTADRLARPPTVYPPNQADQGHQVYFMVCMACHGDKGQGLTDEWRSAVEMENSNCWQSGCHNPKHPPGGFVFPKVVPRVIGGGAMARFQTAQELHDYLREKMPWQNPGYLKADEYWQLTAFLLRENGLYNGATLSAENAAQVILRQQNVPTALPTPAAAQPVFLLSTYLPVGLVLVLAAVIGLFVYFRSRR